MSKAWWKCMLAGAAACLSMGAAQADDIVIGQVAPLSGVLADTGKDLSLIHISEPTRPY